MRLLARSSFSLLVVGIVIGSSSSASATLTTFQSYSGNVAVSVNGGGSTSSTLPNGLTASVPTGSTVISAYLYTSTYDLNLGPAGNSVPNATAGGTLNGQNVSYSALVPNPSSDVPLQAGRANVTSIVQAEINPSGNAAAGGIYNFAVTETNSTYQDGEVLVVVYSNAALPVGSVGILDGAASSTGDMSSINFGSSPAGDTAILSIGDGFSYNPNNSTGQASTIKVDGSLLTSAAGNCDSSQDGSCNNGDLITAGTLGFNSNGSVNTAYSNAFTPIGDVNANTDHELYNISSLVSPAAGDTITLQTVNTSLDDNIFLETFYVNGVAGFNAPPPTTSVTPEPGTLSLMGLAIASLGLVPRFRTRFTRGG